jgi:hypothetical protein
MAGAAAIEPNIYYLPGDTHMPSRDVEQRHIDVLRRVKDVVTVPVAVKLGPHFSSTGEICASTRPAPTRWCFSTASCSRRSTPETLAVVSGVGLCSPADARLPRTWIALLHGRVRASLAATAGVEGPADVAGYLLPGADVVMTMSAPLRHGPAYVAVLLDGLSAWMARNEFGAVDDLRGTLSVAPGAAAEGPRSLQDAHRVAARGGVQNDEPAVAREVPGLADADELAGPGGGGHEVAEGVRSSEQRGPRPSDVPGHPLLERRVGIDGDRAQSGRELDLGARFRGGAPEGARQLSPCPELAHDRRAGGRERQRGGDGGLAYPAFPVTKAMRRARSEGAGAEGRGGETGGLRACAGTELRNQRTARDSSVLPRENSAVLRRCRDGDAR